MNDGENMAKIRLELTIELTKPDITGTDFEAIKQWIQDNIIDKLPQNATQTHDLQYTP